MSMHYRDVKKEPLVLILSRTRCVRFSRALFSLLLVRLMDDLSLVLLSDFSDGNSFLNLESYDKWWVNMFIMVC